MKNELAHWSKRTRTMVSFYVAKLLIYKEHAWIPRNFIGYLCLCVSQHFKMLSTCFCCSNDQHAPFFDSKYVKVHSGFQMLYLPNGVVCRQRESSFGAWYCLKLFFPTSVESVPPRIGLENFSWFLLLSLWKSLLKLIFKKLSYHKIFYDKQLIVY